MPYRRRRGQDCVRLADRHEPTVRIMRHLDHPAAGRLDMHKQLLGRCHLLSGGLVTHGVEQVQALRPDMEQLQRHPELVAERRLAQMMQVRFGGVERVACAR